MTENTRKKIVYAALCLAVIWGAYNIFYKKRITPAPPVEPGISMIEATTLAASAAGGVFYVDNPEAYKDAVWGKDLFQRKTAPVGQAAIEAQPSIWRLSGIVYSPDRPIAIINSKTVSVGDMIDDASVVEISPKSVTLKQNGRTFTLTVNRG